MFYSFAAGCHFFVVGLAEYAEDAARVGLDVAWADVRGTNGLDERTSAVG